jgi:hypothetical protein
LAYYFCSWSLGVRDYTETAQDSKAYANKEALVAEDSANLQTSSWQRIALGALTISK